MLCCLFPLTAALADDGAWERAWVPPSGAIVNLCADAHWPLRSPNRPRRTAPP